MKDLAQVNHKLDLEKRVTDILGRMKQITMSSLLVELQIGLHQPILFTLRDQPHKQRAGQGFHKQHTELK